MASAKAIVEMLMEGLAQGRSSKGLPEPTVTGRKVSCMGVNCPITMENLWNIIILKLFEESIDGLFSIAMLRQPEGRKWVNKNVVYIYIYGIYLSLYIYIFHMGLYEWYMDCKDYEPRVRFVDARPRFMRFADEKVPVWDTCVGWWLV